MVTYGSEGFCASVEITVRLGNCVSEIQIQLKPVGGFSDNEFRRAIVGNCKDLCVIINVTGSVCVRVMSLLYQRSLSKKHVTPTGFLIINLSQGNWAWIKALAD